MPPNLKNNTRLGRAARVWRSVANPKHFDVPVHEPRWRRLYTLGNQLRETLTDESLRQGLRILLYRIGNVPLPLSSESSWPAGSADKFIQDLRVATSGLGHSASAEFLDLLEELRAPEEQHPLWTRTIELLGEAPRPTCIVCRRRSHAEQLAPFASKLSGSPLVIVHNDVDALSFRASAITFGPSATLPEWMRAMPYAPTYWVRFDWNRPPMEPQGFLPHSSGPKRKWAMETVSRPGTDGPPLPVKGDFVEVLEPIDWSIVSKRLVRPLHRDTDLESDELVPAIAATLSDSRIVLLPVEGRTTVFDPETREVRGLSGNVVRAGQFVVVREERGGDQIRRLVEKYLVNPETARSHLHTWKRALRQAIRMRGLEKVASELGRRGVGAIAPTIKSWGTDSVYGPGDRVWFDGLLRYLEIGEAETHWSVVEAYRSAGRTAGQDLRRLLLEQVEQMDIVQANKNGEIRFELEGIEGGVVVAYKLEDVRPAQMEVRERYLGKVLSIGEPTWQG